MVIDQVQENQESFINNAQAVKELTVNKLIELGLLDKEEGNAFLDSYQIIIVNPKWYERWVKKIFKEEKDTWLYKIVKF